MMRLKFNPFGTLQGLSLFKIISNFDFDGRSSMLKIYHFLLKMAKNLARVLLKKSSLFTCDYILTFPQFHKKSNYLPVITPNSSWLLLVSSSTNICDLLCYSPIIILSFPIIFCSRG